MKFWNSTQCSVCCRCRKKKRVYTHVYTEQASRALQVKHSTQLHSLKHEHSLTNNTLITKQSNSDIMTDTTAVINAHARYKTTHLSVRTPLSRTVSNHSIALNH